MQSRVMEHENEMKVVLVFETGEEVIEGLRGFAERNGIVAAHFTAIGTFRDAKFGYFNFEKKDFDQIPINEQVEVLFLNGDVAQQDGNVRVHAQVVVGKHDGTAHGGHLLEAHVQSTVEVILIESPEHLQRWIDEETGLALIDLSETAV